MPQTGDVRWWYPAEVPGSVLHDLMENGLVPDPYYEMNSKLAEWVPDRTWVYKKEFFVPEDLKGKRITLVFEGIDYSSEIFLNGVSLGKQEGMYVPWSMDVSAKLLPGETNLLAVVLEPAPPSQPQVGKTSLVYTHKSRMTYWWDFCPRMIHQGIWQDVYLKVNRDNSGNIMIQQVVSGTVTDSIVIKGNHISHFYRTSHGLLFLSHNLCLLSVLTVQPDYSLRFLCYGYTFEQFPCCKNTVDRLLYDQMHLSPSYRQID